MKAALIALAALLAGPLWAAPPAAPASPAPTTFEIDRATALTLLARPDRLAGELWLAHPDAEAIKARARGEKVDRPPPPPGLILRGLKAGGWADQLGLRDGDVLQRLDGSEVDGAASLLAVALRLNARLMIGGGWGFDAQVLRDGRPLTLRYVVHEGQTAEPAPTPTQE